MAQDNDAKHLPDQQRNSSYRAFLDLIDQDLPITTVLQMCGPEFDIAVDEVLDGLGAVRTCLDNLMISTMGNNPPVSPEVARQLHRTSCVCNLMMTGVQGELARFVQKMQTLVAVETIKSATK
jgi:hypothetical protein